MEAYVTLEIGAELEGMKYDAFQKSVARKRDMIMNQLYFMQILHIIMLKSIIRTDSMEKIINDYMTVLIK